MNRYYADLHIHLGRDGEGRPIKVSASSDLTISGVIEECSARKGIHIAGIVDCHAPGVLHDLERLITARAGRELPGGGIWVPPRRGDSRIEDGRSGDPGGDGGVTVIPASEVELSVNGDRFHLIAYLPSIDVARGFSSWLEPRVTNLGLSSQRCKADPGEVVESVKGLGGFCVPAHVFTPHRGVLGCCAERLASVFDPSSLDGIPAVELGLSADTDMADTIDEMARYTFLSNSDAHSRATIGRECNLLLMKAPGFSELESLLRREGPGRVVVNYGLDPRLGKYHRTLCLECGMAAGGVEAGACPACGSVRVVAGVWDRVRRIASYDHPVHPADRPPYVHQTPLSFIPGVGPKTLDRMIARFGSEMNALHQASRDELIEVAGGSVADRVMAAREGRLKVRPGAGGRYGRITSG